MTGKFQTQIKWCETFFKHISLFEEKIDNPSKLAAPLSTIRQMTYEETWKFYFSNRLYNLQLKDSSLIFFHFTSDTNYSFSYYQCPYEVLSYKDFLVEQDFDYYEVGEDLWDEYEIYLSQATRKEAPLTLRYDFAPKDYNEGLHPASHLHIGFDTNIRIGFKCLLDPQTFALLITRQCYPNDWINVISGLDKFKSYEKLLAKYKNELKQIDSANYKTKDGYEHYLI